MKILTMIRLPPTAITLGPGDSFDFEIRQRHNRAKGKTAQLVPAADTPQAHLKVEGVDNCLKSESSSVFEIQHPEDGSATGDSMDDELQSPILCLDTTNSEPENESLLDGTSSFAYTHVVGGYKYRTVGVQQSPPSKSDFHYGGFIESPTPRDADNSFQTSSTFGKSILVQLGEY